MAVRFSDDQVVQATGATRTRAGERVSYSAVCTDSRSLTPGCLFVALKGDTFDAHDFVPQAIVQGAAGVVVQQGRLAAAEHRAAVFEVLDTLAALGGLANFHRRRFSLPVGAVTGSNGKTTTKELVAAILGVRGPALKTQGNLNNEVGVPLTLFGLEPRHVAAIIEMGMNHPGEIARLTAIAEPTAGLITAVQPAHLAGVGSLEGVARAKGELFVGLAPTSTAVVNLDDSRIAAQAQGLSAKVMTFGKAPQADVRLAAVEPRGREGLRLTIDWRSQSYAVALKLVGEHNALNATGAFALALALGYQPEECVRGLESAVAHARRLQILDAPKGVTVIDDCYNANPASMAAALRTLAQLAQGRRAIAVLGDMLELGATEQVDHAQLGLTAASLASRLAFFGPRMAFAHAEAARSLGRAAHHFDDVAPLLQWLDAELQPGDVVLVKGSRGMRLERVVAALLGSPEQSASGGAH